MEFVPVKIFSTYKVIGYDVLLVGGSGFATNNIASGYKDTRTLAFFQRFFSLHTTQSAPRVRFASSENNNFPLCEVRSLQ